MNTTRSRAWFPAMVAVLAMLYIVSLGLFSYQNWRVGSAPGDIITSAVLLSVPLILLYGSIGLLVVAVQQKRSRLPASPLLAKWIYWTPRIAGILISLFVGAFALDVFTPEYTAWQQFLAFMIHAAPAIAMLILVMLAWRWPAVGFVAFALAALFFMRFVIFSPLQGLGMIALFAGPMAVIAALFWMNWKWGKWLRPSSRAGDGGERQHDDREQQVQAQE